MCAISGDSRRGKPGAGDSTGYGAAPTSMAYETIAARSSNALAGGFVMPAVGVLSRTM